VIFKPKLDANNLQAIIPPSALLPWETYDSSDQNLKTVKIFKTPEYEWPVNNNPDWEYHVMFYYLPDLARSDNGV